MRLHSQSSGPGRGWISVGKEQMVTARCGVVGSQVHMGLFSALGILRPVPDEEEVGDGVKGYRKTCASP